MEFVQNFPCNIGAFYNLIKQNNQKEFKEITKNDESLINIEYLCWKYNKKMPLMFSIENDCSDIFDVLLSISQKVNHQDASGYSPLHIVALTGNEYYAKALIDNGANINLKDNAGNTPLLNAFKQCRPRLGVISILISKPNILMDAKDTDGRTALHLASHKAIGTELLLKAGAKPTVIDNTANTPLHCASMEGFDNTVKCLIEYGADINLQNEFGRTSLHYLAMKGHVDAMQMLIDHGAELNLVDNEGKSALWYAVANSRFEAAKILLINNCLPYIMNSSLTQPIVLAYSYDNLDLFYLSLMVGCPVTLLKSPDTQLNDITNLMITNPASLRHLSRLKIRQIMRQSNQKISSLKIILPLLLIEFLEFNAILELSSQELKLNILKIYA